MTGLRMPAVLQIALLVCLSTAGLGKEAKFDLPAAFVRVTVVDGDTVRLVPTSRTAGQTIRIFGLDTPETHGKCDAEKQRAATAKDRLTQLVARGVRVSTNLLLDKYGRHVASLYDRDGRNIAEVMVSEGLARFYNGEGARQGWC